MSEDPFCHTLAKLSRNRFPDIKKSSFLIKNIYFIYKNKINIIIFIFLKIQILDMKNRFLIFL